MTDQPTETLRQLDDAQRCGAALNTTLASAALLHWCDNHHREPDWTGWEHLRRPWRRWARERGWRNHAAQPWR